MLHSWSIMDKIFVFDSLDLSPCHSILYLFVSDLHRCMLCATENNQRQIFRSISGKPKISKVSYFGLQRQIHRTIVHVGDISVTSVRHCLILWTTNQILYTKLTDISYEEFWSDSWTVYNWKLRTWRWRALWGYAVSDLFRVAKICKDRKKIVYILNFNFFTLSSQVHFQERRQSYKHLKTYFSKTLVAENPRTISDLVWRILCVRGKVCYGPSV